MGLSFRKLFSRKLRNFPAARDGVAAVEFGFAAPVVILASVGLIELGTMMFANSLVEGALREAARFGITGFSPVGVSREERILQIVEDRTNGIVDMQTATVSQLIYPSFGDVGKPEPYDDSNPVNGSYDLGESFQDINGNGVWDADMGAAGAGGPGAVVLYTIAVDWPAMTPLFAPFMGTGGKIRMGASVAVRNEPFDTTVTP